MKKALTVIAILLLTGCVSKKIQTDTTNFDQAGAILNQRNEIVKVRGFLATSKTVGLQGGITYNNTWVTNKLGKAVLTNTAAASITLQIQSTESDVSDNAADVIGAGGTAVGEGIGGVVEKVVKP